MIRWWRTGWAPIQQALNAQRERDSRKFSGWVWRNGGWHLPKLDIHTTEGVTVRLISGVTVEEATEGFRRFGDFLHRHPELIEDP